MRHLTVAVMVVVETLLLTLPGYFSDWWPVWGQIACLFSGVLALAAGTSLLVWMLDKGEDR